MAMSDFACWVSMGMKLSEWVGRHHSIWVGRSSTYFHNFTVTCFWKLCWFGISDSMKCSILQRVLRDVSQISLVCFIIGMIGTMMKAAAEQTDRVLRDTSQISLNLWCSVSWSERPTGGELQQAADSPGHLKENPRVPGEPWRSNLVTLWISWTRITCQKSSDALEYLAREDGLTAWPVLYDQE